MLLRAAAPVSALLLAAGPLPAQTSQCVDQVISRGNNVTGRTLAVSQDYHGVAAAALFESLRSALGAASDRLGAVQIAHSDPARGVISGSVILRGAARPAALEATVVVLPSGDAQVSLTNRLPAAMFVSSREWATATCGFLAGLSASADGSRTVGQSEEPARGPTRPAMATDEARAAADGLPYFKAVAGTIARHEEIDRFRLHGGAPGDTVRVWTRDPREHALREGLGGWTHLNLKTSVRDLGAGRTLPEQPGGDMILSGAGPFEVRVESEGAAIPYLLQVSKTSNRPEHAAVRIATTDTIRGEGIDYPGDIDEFLFAGHAGEEIQVYVGGHPSLVYSVYRGLGRSMDDNLRRGSAGIIRLPANGTYVLRLGVAFLNSDPFWTGPYWFRLRRRD